ncbi:hypothetical protein BELL_0113g00180 [Botrytis elliptica]|uniref:A-kinase anchor protein 7-like phosphoesterase domain-containing protein n=1 Tax=Botrytis elliptica TaxID=278938 RepID=A0A4Z1K060_9HELO|nr:hypothetical protein EAE99_005406 [Botrytis elliptica]TGO77330.1 hypothetical protein BELL_0113g00180 [Botrytis elliptica]
MPPKPPRPRLTHFLCIPLTTPSSHPQLQHSLRTFKNDVTTPPTDEQPNRIPIPSDAIRPFSTLHLTIGVMSLESTERIQGAICLLQGIFSSPTLVPRKENEGTKEIKTEIKDIQLPKITLTSLHPMHQPWSTSILYTSPQDPHSYLQTFCQSLKDAFTTAGFMLPEEQGRSLLLHATIVNTIYVRGGRQDSSADTRETGTGNARGNRGRGRGGSSSGHGKHKARLTFDARDIISKYADFTWMRDVRVEKVAICRMGAKKKGDGDEEYEVEAEIEVPCI